MSDLEKGDEKVRSLRFAEQSYSHDKVNDNVEVKESQDRVSPLQGAAPAFSTNKMSNPFRANFLKRFAGGLSHRNLRESFKRESLYGTHTAQNVTSNQNAQNPNSRTWMKFKPWLQPTKQREVDRNPTQYRLQSQSKANYWRRYAGATEDEDVIFKLTFSLSSIVVRHLYWMFQSNPLILVTYFLVTYWAYTFLWAAFIYALAQSQPMCLQIGNLDPTKATGHFFLDVYQLSWTTFTATGYGAISSQISVNTKGHDCIGMNVLVCLESFIGFLFASFTGAIIFAKMIKGQSYAHVAFSDIAVIKYGDGVANTVDASDHDYVPEVESSNPFPTLEFRVINMYHNRETGGEIINAKVRCIASIAENTAADALLLSAGCQCNNTKKMHKDKARHAMNHAFGSAQAHARNRNENNSFHTLKKKMGKALQATQSDDSTSRSRRPSSGSTRMNIFSKIAAGNPFSSLTEDGTTPTNTKEHEEETDQANVIDEGVHLATGGIQPALIDEGSSLVPRTIFGQLELTTSTHPLFKRVWYLRHEINTNSPLLKGKARKLIAANGGRWPEELNSHEKIREHVNVEEIIVSFSGNSNINGKAVYKQKVYNFQDIFIGYRFATLLYRDATDKVAVDDSLLNDVEEQRGGGGEPLQGFGGQPGCAGEGQGG